MPSSSYSFKALITALAASSLLAGCNGSSSTAVPAISSQDSSFVSFAAMSSNSEIASANLALTHSNNASVLQFAQKMITDHTNANVLLASQDSVRKNGVSLPTASLPAEATIGAQLSALNGTAFDRAYLSDQVNAHQVTIANFTTEASSGSASDVIQFAQAQLPILQMHLSMAQQLAATPGI